MILGDTGTFAGPYKEDSQRAKGSQNSLTAKRTWDLGLSAELEREEGDFWEQSAYHIESW